MIHFILYEADDEYLRLYYRIINQIFSETMISYKIIEKKKYEDKLEEKLLFLENKIIIMDVNVPGKSGLDLAKTLRNLGDYKTPIMIIASQDYIKDNDYLFELTIFGYISKYYDLENVLKNKILLAYKMITSNVDISFKYKNVIYQLPINDILYIEKQYNLDGVTIFTNNNSYRTNRLLKEIINELNYDPRFFKINKSCYINLFNVRKYLKKDNVIEFDNLNYVDIIDSNKKNMLERILMSKEL